MGGGDWTGPLDAAGSPNWPAVVPGLVVLAVPGSLTIPAPSATPTRTITAATATTIGSADRRRVRRTATGAAITTDRAGSALSTTGAGCNGAESGAVGGATRAADDPSPKPAPHSEQKRACDVRGAPHCAQCSGTAEPHWKQNLASAVRCPPHDSHVPANDFSTAHLQRSKPSAPSSDVLDPAAASAPWRFRRQSRLTQIVELTPTGEASSTGRPYNCVVVRERECASV